MKKLNQRELIILALTVLMILAYGVFQFVIKPIQEGSEDIDSRITVAERKLAKNMAVINQAPALEAEYERLINYLGKASSEGAEASAMVARLEAAAREAGVHIANMQPQRAISKDILRIFPMELIIEGKWAKVVRFIYLVQAKPNLFNIDELNLEKYSDTASDLRGRLLLSRVKVAAGN